MTLHEFIKSKGITQREAAALLDMDETQVSRYLSGKALPSIPTAAEIEKKTKGAVPIASWLGVYESLGRR